MRRGGRNNSGVSTTTCVRRRAHRPMPLFSRLAHRPRVTVAPSHADCFRAPLHPHLFFKPEMQIVRRASGPWRGKRTARRPTLSSRPQVRAQTTRLLAGWPGRLSRSASVERPQTSTSATMKQRGSAKADWITRSRSTPHERKGDTRFVQLLMPAMCRRTPRWMPPLFVRASAANALAMTRDLCCVCGRRWPGASERADVAALCL